MLLQVRPVRAEPAGAGDGLVERGVDAPVGGDLEEQTLSVGPRSFSTSRYCSNGPMNSGHCSCSFSSDEASVDAPVLVFLTGVKPRSVNRIWRS